VEAREEGASITEPRVAQLQARVVRERAAKANAATGAARGGSSAVSLPQVDELRDRSRFMELQFAEVKGRTSACVSVTMRRS